MDNPDNISNEIEQEIVEVVTVEPIAEANVAAVAEAEPGVVVAKPKRGLGLAALFTRKKKTARGELTEDAPEMDSTEPVQQITDSTEEQSTAPDEAVIDDISPHKNGKLKHVIECMLFVATDPLSSKQLADILELDDERIDQAVNALESDLDTRGGLQLMRVAGGYQLCTRPEYADYCAMLLQPAKKKLSKAALETLAVVAYRQPCTMPEIEAVRGVSVDGVMKTLEERGLVKEAGRKQTPGRPILYATTAEFLEYFGLNDISELPDIDMLAVEEVRALEAQRELFATGGATQEEAVEAQTSEEE